MVKITEVPDDRLDSNQANFKSLESQIGQLSKRIENTEKHQFRASTEVNPKEECKVVIIGEKKKAEDDLVNKGNSENRDKEMVGVEKRKESQEIEEASEFNVSGGKEEMRVENSHDGRFREILNQVTMVPEVNPQSPPYVERINVNLEEETELTDEEEDVTVQPLKRDHPFKVKDPGCVTLSCALNDFDVEAMIDSGSNINMMPTNFLTKIRGIVLKPSDLTVMMADGSVRIPMGMVEDVIV
ncbi:uncharacterized protein LOC106763580 [Vigna radiata var. radiata]|uniref:Uncharacterized protein LOC106763580 n=1 Tax=Vigna radiata var. radiata TaxID=3916 RepID=A0A1S3UB93_VIGRR|nr:uncharacterized protein LOC106763580 [Vigna radiata var. radiata]